jgi:hypothetical protein
MFFLPLFNGTNFNKTKQIAQLGIHCLAIEGLENQVAPW